MLKEKLMELRYDDNAIAQAIGGLVALLVGIIIGIMVFWEINESLVFPGYGPTTGLGLSGYNSTMTAWAGINSTASTVWTMAPIVAIVAIAGIVLALIMTFGQGRGNI